MDLLGGIPHFESQLPWVCSFDALLCPLMFDHPRPVGKYLLPHLPKFLDFPKNLNCLKAVIQHSFNIPMMIRHCRYSSKLHRSRPCLFGTYILLGGKSQPMDNFQ